MSALGQIDRPIAVLALLAADVSSLAYAASIRETIAAWPRTQTPDGLMVRQTPEDLQGLRRLAEDRHLNCPKPTGLFDEGENASGWVFRLECKSDDEKSGWKLRIVFKPSGPPTMAPW